jgi:hypothetical protein
MIQLQPQISQNEEAIPKRIENRPLRDSRGVCLNNPDADPKKHQPDISNR